MTRRRVVHHHGAAWVTAAVGSWLLAASCRTMQGNVVPPPATAGPTAPAAPDAVPPPAIRVGILVGVERASIGVESGVVVRGRAVGHSAGRAWPLRRATFRPGTAPGRIRLLETGDELELATVSPALAGELLQAEASPYRGLLEVRPADEGKLTVVNVVHLEDYLRGVVPNELSPQAFPQLEALKAQAVAARTYALAHVGDYSSKGYDVCATPSCQVYRGQASEQPLTDRAVADTRGIVATWRGRPINAYYTSTCGGHTEAGGPIFGDAAPYLKGVACPPERSSRHTVRTTAAPRQDLPGGPGVSRDVALLAALGVIDAADGEPARLTGLPSDAEVRSWTARLQAALQRPGCESPVSGALARRATFALHLVASACWTERAEHVSGLVGEGERRAVALLRHEGLMSSTTLRPDAALTRAEAFTLLAGVVQKAGAPALAVGEMAGLAGGQLSVLHGEAADSLPLDSGVRLFRDLEGAHSGASELTLSLGDHVVYVERGGRIVYLEAEQSRRGVAADGSSRYYNWEVRMTPAEVARAVGRYGFVGEVHDLVPKRLGVSGRVVELAVVGSAGQLSLKGLRVRWGLGLRENLFVIDRETGLRGEVKGFVFTGKGWGHGVGLCQVGAFGMAQTGSKFEEILAHYYTGVKLRRSTRL